MAASCVHSDRGIPRSQGSYFEINRLHAGWKPRRCDAALIYMRRNTSSTRPWGEISCAGKVETSLDKLDNLIRGWC